MTRLLTFIAAVAAVGCVFGLVIILGNTAKQSSAPRGNVIILAHHSGAAANGLAKRVAH